MNRSASPGISTFSTSAAPTPAPARGAGAFAGLAAVPALIWGVNFAVIDAGLSGFPPLLFAALRFALVGACCLVVPRPRVAASRLLLVGLFMGTGQYGLLYLGMAAGMPSGLSALVMQAQVPFTILIAAVVPGERPTARQGAGVAVSLVGLAAVGAARGGAVTIGALLLVTGGAACFAAGNIFTRLAQADSGFRLVVWSSLVPPLPLFALSLAAEGPRRDADAVAHAGPGAWLALAATVVLASLLSMGLWSALLGRYPADRVVPYALAIPVVGLATGWLVRGEQITTPTVGGAGLVLGGLALVVMPAARSAADRGRSAGERAAAGDELPLVVEGEGDWDGDGDGDGADADQAAPAKDAATLRA